MGIKIKFKYQTILGLLILIAICSYDRGENSLSLIRMGTVVLIYAAIEKAKADIKVLDGLNFNSVLMGDGNSIPTGGKKAIEQFLDTN